MALTRSFLKGMSLTEEQVSAIVEAHTETIAALKEQRDEFKEDAEKFKSTKKELDDLKADIAERNDDEWKSKYEQEHSDFEKYKADQATAKAVAEKVEAYKKLLKDIGISEKRIDSIVKISDLKDIEIKDGQIVKTDELKEALKEEWKEFIVDTGTKGANTDNPPGNDGASAFKDMSLADKMQYANDNPTAPEVVEWLK